MNKGGNKLAISFIIAIIIVGGLFWLVNNKQDIGSKTTAVDLEALSAEYKIKVGQLMPSYEQLLDESTVDAGTISSLKEELLELKMPTEFKDLHIELVLLLDQLEDSGVSNDLQNKFEALKTNYDWLK